VSFEALRAALAENAAAVARTERERDRPVYCPHDSYRLVWRRGCDGSEEAACPRGDYTWP